MLNADLMTDKELIKLVGKIVEVEDIVKTTPKVSHYIFKYKGKKYKIQKKFTTKVEE